MTHGLISFCQKEGIIHESSCVKTPQQNGIAERKNGHLLDQTRALLFQHEVPKRFWVEAVLTACYLINRLPSIILASKSPMEVLSSFYPNVSTSNQLVPRIFGCVSFLHVHSGNRGNGGRGVNQITGLFGYNFGGSRLKRGTSTT